MSAVVGEVLQLLGFSAAMLAGCFAAGLLPLSLTLSEKNIQVSLGGCTFHHARLLIAMFFLSLGGRFATQSGPASSLAQHWP